MNQKSNSHANHTWKCVVHRELHEQTRKNKLHVLPSLSSDTGSKFLRITRRTSSLKCNKPVALPLLSEVIFAVFRWGSSSVAAVRQENCSSNSRSQVALKSAIPVPVSPRCLEPPLRC